MKIKLKHILFYVALIGVVNGYAQNISINADGSAPDNSAMLDISDTTRGILIPRMTAAQRIAIVSPANGLMVFQTDLEFGMYSYFSSQSTWSRVVYDSTLSLNRILELGNDGDNDTIYNLGALAIGSTLSPKSSVEIGDNLVIQGTPYLASNFRWFGSNTYVDGTDIRYLTTGNVGLMLFGAGKTQFGHWESGIKDAILFSEPNTSVALDDNGIQLSGINPNMRISLKGIVIPDSLRINNAYSFPDTIGTVGQVLQSDGTGLLNWSSTGTSSWTNVGTTTNLTLGTQLGVGTATVGANVKQQITTGGPFTTGLLIDHQATAGGTEKIGLQIDVSASGASKKYASRSTVLGKSNDPDSLFGHYVEITPDDDVLTPPAFAFKSKFLGTDGTTYGIYTENEDFNYFSGNVGIGVTSPTGELDITGSIVIRDDATVIIPSGVTSTLLTNTSGVGLFGAFNGASTAPLEVVSSKISIRTGPNTAGTPVTVTVDSDGNVGIGETNPTALLEFDNAIINKKLSLFTKTDNDHEFLGFGTGFGELRYQLDESTTDHVFYSAIDATSSLELMRVTGDGNVGIGTDNPGDKLEAYSSTNVRILATANSNDFAGFTAQNLLGEYFIGVQGNGSANPGEFQIFQNSGGGNSGRRLVIDHDGNVGIGNSDPSETLDVLGSIVASGTITSSSDKRLKTNIEPILNVLGTLDQINGVYHYWDTLNFPKRNVSDKRTLGVIAQEVQKIYPELVVEDNKGFLSVDYSKFSAVLLQAIKEQQLLIDQQNQNNERQQNDIDSLKEELQVLKKLIQEK